MRLNSLSESTPGYFGHIVRHCDKISLANLPTTQHNRFPKTRYFPSEEYEFRQGHPLKELRNFATVTIAVVYIWLEEFNGF